jgi:hypothetical protein
MYVPIVEAMETMVLADHTILQTRKRRVLFGIPNMAVRALPGVEELGRDSPTISIYDFEAKLLTPKKTSCTAKTILEMNKNNQHEKVIWASSIALPLQSNATSISFPKDSNIHNASREA